MKYESSVLTLEIVLLINQLKTNERELQFTSCFPHHVIKRTRLIMINLYCKNIIKYIKNTYSDMIILYNANPWERLGFRAKGTYSWELQT